MGAMENEAFPVPSRAVYTHPADIALAEFGYDPHVLHVFSTKTPAERLAAMTALARFVVRARRQALATVRN